MLNEKTIRFRYPDKEDGAAVWRLVKETETLDLNAVYCYIMLCDYFRSTCVIAEDEDGIVGFLSAFRSPEQQDCLFIWQIAVKPSRQRRGIGKQMLHELLLRESSTDIRYLKATVSPSNLASRGLFLHLAKSHNLECHLFEGYAASMFPSERAHEEEILYKLGPLPRKAVM
ncbi:diaminobutyrate acetyltransferase [Paenibacillus silviterrae]|uniref:diaminobutyrate acetyltransferase n=1 Tax=Paenibacillus silviterrae TaxID=3242194 RepID=UPI00254280F3|nr:diaminobutyrate acetyltransferase [Paenibacillus chinjuensis]